jgi:hypothetical protein
VTEDGALAVCIQMQKTPNKYGLSRGQKDAREMPKEVLVKIK